MPRIRTIKPEFFRSPDTAKVGYQERVLYAAMWCWADDYGVGETNINGLLGMAFPDDDEVSAADMVQLLANIRDAYGVTFYTVRGRHYYEIPSWDEHQKTQRRASRRFPTPDDPDSVPDLRIQHTQGTSEFSQGIAPVGKGTGEREQGKGKGTELALVEGVQGETPAKAGGTRTRKQKRAPLPDEFFPTEESITKIKDEFPGVTKNDLEYQHRKFCDHAAQNNRLAAQWDSAWRNWMRTADERGDLRRNRSGQPVAKNDLKVSGYLEAGRRLAASMESGGTDVE